MGVRRAMRDDDGAVLGFLDDIPGPMGTLPYPTGDPRGVTNPDLLVPLASEDASPVDVACRVEPLRKLEAPFDDIRVYDAIDPEHAHAVLDCLLGRETSRGISGAPGMRGRLVHGGTLYSRVSGEGQTTPPAWRLPVLVGPSATFLFLKRCSVTLPLAFRD